MAEHLPLELYLPPPRGSRDAVERVCAHATNRAIEEIVAVAVPPHNVAQAAHLLFGTGIGVVSSIDDPDSDLIDQARRSVATGATEISLPRLEIDQAAVLTRLRSRLGPFTPVTVTMTAADGQLDLAGAEAALRLGADYVAYSPRINSPSANRDITALLDLANHLQLGGVKVTAAEDGHSSLVRSGAGTIDRVPTRIRLPISLLAP